MDSHHLCPRCGYSSAHTSDFKKHLNKKKLCNPKISDIDLKDIIEKYNKKKDGKYQCEHCKKTFVSTSGLYYHKNVCKNAELNTLNARVLSLELENEKIKEHNIHQNIINNNNNNNTYNIQINNRLGPLPFGQENMEPLDKKTIGDLFLYLRIPELLQTLHCNPQYPENHNIRIKSVKRKAIEIFRGDKWDIVSYVNGLNEYLLRGQQIFKEYYDKNKDAVKEEMTKDELEQIKKTMEDIENLEINVLKKFHNDLAFMLETMRDSPNKINGNSINNIICNI